MKPAINIQTKDGLEYWYSISSQYEYSKRHGLLDWFKTKCMVDNARQEKELIVWIDEHDLEEHPEDWNTYRTMADKQATMSYFSKVRA